MNTSRPSTFRWSKAFFGVGSALLLAVAGGLSGQGGERDLPPFLEKFQEGKEPPVVANKVALPTILGPVAGYLVRPSTSERLPAVLLIPGKEGLTAWLKESARDLASVGYVVLAVAPPAAAKDSLADEKALAQLGAAVRWLRRRPDVLPAQVGVAGWNEGGGQALALAAATPLQACVICDGPISDDPALLAGLGRTPVLGLFGAKGRTNAAALDRFRKVLTVAHVPHRLHVYDNASVGFMGPPYPIGESAKAADTAWVEVYEFLGKYVEDVPAEGTAAAPPRKHLAAIEDLMHAMNGPDGLRGQLTRLVETPPASKKQWIELRSDALLLAEIGTLLEDRRPFKGTGDSWRLNVHAFQKTAQDLAAAAERRDLAAARRGLEALSARCAACHEKHR